MREGDLDQLLAQGHGQCRPGAQAGHPHAVDAAEFDEAVGECRRDEDGEIGADRALVSLQLEKASSLLANGLGRGGLYQVVAEDAAGQIWQKIADLHAHAAQAANALRLSVPLSNTRNAFEVAARRLPECIATAEIATGILRVGFDADDRDSAAVATELRTAAHYLHGSLTIERAAPAVRRTADAWDDIGAAAETMTAIKSKFDPASLLNPGRFVAGI